MPLLALQSPKRRGNKMTKWRLEGDIALQNLDVVYGSGRIAMLDCENDQMCDEELLANANLIAAAPDLLEALEIARDRLEINNHQGEEDDALALIEAAIAKAKGI